MTQSNHLPLTVVTTDGKPVAGKGPLHLELHPYLLFRIKPEQQHPLFSINRLGFRSPSPEDLSKVRGVIAGSSTAFGWPAGGTRSWVTILQQKVEQKLGHPYPILNAGVLGYTLPIIRRQLTDILLEVRPDWVIVIAGWSDWFNVLYHMRSEPLFPYHSLFFHIQNLLGSQYDLKSSHPVDIQNLGPRIVEAMAKEIEKLFYLHRVFDVPLYFYYQPMLTRRTARSSHERQLIETLGQKISHYFEYADFMETLLSQQAGYLAGKTGNSVIYIDADDIEVTGERFHDHIHLTLAGQYWLARTIYNHLAEKGHVPPFEHPAWEPSSKTAWTEAHAVLPACPMGSIPRGTEVHVRISDSDIPTVYTFRQIPGDITQPKTIIPDQPASRIQLRQMDTQGRVSPPATSRWLLQPIPAQIRLEMESIPLEKMENLLPEEKEGPPDYRTYRWVTLERCWGTFPPSEKPSYLEIVTSPLNPDEPGWLWVTVDQHLWASIPLEPGWCRYRIAVPPGAPSLMGDILLEFEPALTPQDKGIAPDPRLLVARIHSLSWIYTR